ncbi:inositolphosphorylceramide-B C-26 hydroxylase [Protomyces lactucae-debilis]|uniref:Ceramide very long chain fatty acid hydroxylase n=1 Tax=Protomyces lactucae-debilis TaxID=2754530 RepID=A0A1Y2FF95_PROLT|nr:inositolphosphorylceramide-B C-26 hydroxylase [Protomyces lactucae-debilis]ORY82640.1 inositolphosphorylceramide-B C-26 hydroxylase [Protomyces lactucae-debilis]
MRTIQQKELEAHNSSKSCWVTLATSDRVYDVTEFVDDHPGGGELILEYAGRDVDAIMRNEDSHAHSESAFEMMEDYAIGVLTSGAAVMSKLPGQEGQVMSLEEADAEREVFELTGLSCAEDLVKETDIAADHKQHKFIDLDKPMLMQVWRAGFSKKFYLEQVHRPRHYKGGASAPLFGNFLEPLSLTPWWVVPVIWLPCIITAAVVSHGRLGTLPFILDFIFGLILWSFIEYVMHRFLFHVDDYMPDHPAALTAHFLLHGVHHYLPMDRLRLVMPPTLFIALAFPFWKLATALFPYNHALAIFSGGILGYLHYDVGHYMLHHNNLPAYYKELKSYHLAHHYQNYELGFGVSSKFWDGVFGTTLVLQKAS